MPGSTAEVKVQVPRITGCRASQTARLADGGAAGAALTHARGLATGQNRPFWKSSTAARSSSCVFITNGP